jgi:uncharacterized protein YceK
MKLISIVMLILLTGCGALIKHEGDIKLIGHDLMDEELDDLAKEKDKSVSVEIGK